MRHRVEILTCGGKRRVFIDGLEVHGVAMLDTPRGPGVLGPDVVIRFTAAQIVDRAVSAEEFAGPGEKIIRESA